MEKEVFGKKRLERSVWKDADGMGLLKEDDRRQEKMNGVVYNMSPAPNFRHGIINGNVYHKIRSGLKDSLCLVFMENLDFKYHPQENDDYVCPDLMIICDRKHLHGSSYSGVPKFIAETLSPSTVLRDKKEKKDAYEKAGVREYWMIMPQGRAIEIYYLEDGNYVLMHSYILQDEQDEIEEDYNADTVICLRDFPQVTMRLSEIFAHVNE